ncbi:hypothetical protein EDB83DRAFT_2322289 [Lactarius deliciosus]|nr:hypothetical protein EDB83DRAFT_2322289 [Lactarius deliciosus]
MVARNVLKGESVNQVVTNGRSLTKHIGTSQEGTWKPRCKRRGKLSKSGTVPETTYNKNGEKGLGKWARHENHDESEDKSKAKSRRKIVDTGVTQRLAQRPATAATLSFHRGIVVVADSSEELKRCRGLRVAVVTDMLWTRARRHQRGRCGASDSGLPAAAVVVIVLMVCCRQPRGDSADEGEVSSEGLEKNNAALSRLGHVDVNAAAEKHQRDFALSKTTTDSFHQSPDCYRMLSIHNIATATTEPVTPLVSALTGLRFHVQGLWGASRHRVITHE